MKKSFLGFSLAEILIAIAVLGIVAVVVLPFLVSNYTQYALTQAKSLTISKIKASTDIMKVNGELSGYATNEAFVDEFVRNFKTAKRCTTSNMSECFVPTFYLSDGKVISTSSLAIGSDLGQMTNTSSLVGLGLINGVNMLLAFDPTCIPIDVVDNKSDTTSCIAAVYDVNGSSGPNKVGKDIALLNADIGSYLNIGGIRVAPNNTTYVAANTCTNGADYAWDPTFTGANCSENYWAGAKKACAAEKMRLPTAEEALTIYQNKKPEHNIDLSNNYWTSTSAGPIAATAQNFTTGQQYPNGTKSSNCYARCVK